VNEPPPGERPPTLRGDVVAGVTAAAVVLPKAMAYATVAGLPVAAGLYAALVPMAVYALLGTSRVLSVSSTATLGILTGAQLGLAVPDGDPGRLVTAAATLAALVGALLLAGALLRLGAVANFISLPVLTGFKAGIGLVIVLDQLPKLLGVHVEKQGFFTDAVALAQQLPEASLLTLAVAGAAPPRGYELWLAGLNPPVLEVVRRSGLAERLGRDRLLFNAREAIRRYQTRDADEAAPPGGASPA
jgi:MFS superfamily sulfate permease-like transporter